MPTHILFGSLRGREGSVDRVQVEEDPETVVSTLAQSQNGFASFTEASRRGGTIWVNLAQVRALREVGASTGGARAGGSLEDDDEF